MSLGAPAEIAGIPFASKPLRRSDKIYAVETHAPVERLDQMNRGRGIRGPDHEDFNWEPFLWASYLVVLFVPLTWKQTPQEFRSWFFPTLLTLPVFLALYRRNYRRRWRLTLVELLPIALLAYVLTPFNPAAFTYLAYAAFLAPYGFRGLLRPLLLSLALVGLHAAEIVLIHQPQIALTIICATLFSTLSCINGYFRVEGNRKNAALKQSHEEIRRLGAVAERERIGRDLHDLLGHTLSLIAIKSELAGKLVLRDPGEALREIADVTQTARESLKQVRAAVAGIQSPSLEEELLSATKLLESTGVNLTCSGDGTGLPTDTKAALAMIVREAVTNIHRHAGASRARIEITTAPRADHSTLEDRTALAQLRSGSGVVSLLVVDDGRGGATATGHGLTGIQARVGSLEGTLQIESAPGRGTALRVELPLQAQNDLSSLI
jgi:two-component system, NarL family, sensor histidine kinase DesK